MSTCLGLLLASTVVEVRKLSHLESVLIVFTIYNALVSPQPTHSSFIQRYQDIENITKHYGQVEIQIKWF